MSNGRFRSDAFLSEIHLFRRAQPLTPYLVGTLRPGRKMIRIWNLGRLYSLGQFSGSLQVAELGIQLARERARERRLAITAVLTV